MEHLVQVGMRAAVRDVIDFVDHNAWTICDGGVSGKDYHASVVTEQDLRAYLLACLITAGAYEDLSDGQS